MAAVRPVRRTDGLVVAAIGGETLVYDLETDRAHALEPRAAAVWGACDGRRTVAALARETGLAPRLTRLALERLSRARLLDGPLPAHDDGPWREARRRVLRAAAALGGLAVASITAPTPAEAATCLPRGTCVSSPTSSPPCSNNRGEPCCAGDCEQNARACGTGRFGFQCK